MTDITTKLRSGIADLVRQEAAREIDNLRAANRHLIDMHDAVIDDARKYTAAQAEIARLRDALEKIAKGRTGLDPEESDAEWRAYWASLCIDYRGTARAALAHVAEVGNG